MTPVSGAKGMSNSELCVFPRSRYMHMVLGASRDAWAAHQRRPGQGVAGNRRLPRLGCEAERRDLADAVRLTSEIGLPADEGAALVESLRTLGAIPTEVSMESYVEGLNLDTTQREALEERLRDKVVPSATETVRGLIGSYASAQHRYHEEPLSTREEWSFFSELIPGLTVPLKSIATPPARLAARKLLVMLASLCGEQLDGFAGTLWNRADGDSLEGAGASVRALADDFKSVVANQSKMRHRVILEKAKSTFKVSKSSEESRLDAGAPLKGEST